MRVENMMRSALSILLCAAFLLGVPMPARAAEVDGKPQTGVDKTVQAYENQIADIDAKMKAIEEENKALEAQIKGAASEKQQAQVKRGVIDQQIKLTKDEILLLEERIMLKEKEIVRKQADIVSQQREIEENYDLFLKRMRAMYMNDDTTTLGLVLGADDFTTFLTNADTMTRVSAHDEKLLEALIAQRVALEQTKEYLDEQLATLEEDREANEEKRHVLSGQLQAANLQVHTFAQMEAEYNADLAANKAMLDAMKKEIDDLYKKIEWSKNPYVGGQMLWPVPGFYTISSNFGWRFGGSDYHTGMDIAGGGRAIHSAPVVAANAGTVVHVNWRYTPYRGYGIYLMLDHGGNMSTLYAHLSNITVQLGQEVERGEVIGNVGSTGWSTGPHLHFEVRVNGVAQNPKPYVIGGQ